MRTIAIRLAQTADFSAKMIEMRDWFDQRGYEPSRFKYDQYPDNIVIRVQFGDDGEAEAFRSSFGGVDAALQPPSLFESRPQSRVRPSDISGEPVGAAADWAAPATSPG